jgi:hypothetical protein
VPLRIRPNLAFERDSPEAGEPLNFTLGFFERGSIVLEKKKNALFSKIESREEALKVVKDASTGFYIIAALNAALAFIIGFSILFDAIVYLVGGFLIRKYNSKVAAICLLIFASMGAMVTVANKAGANLGGGNNIFLAVIILWAAIRAVDATFKLKKQFAIEAAEGIDEKNT